MTKRAIAAIVTIAVSLFSFSSTYAASGESADLLKYIPADTPYVFVSTEPMPSKLADKFEPTIDGILKAYQRVLRQMMEEQLANMSAGEGGAEAAEQFHGLMDEVLSLMSLEGIRGAGIDRDSTFAFYGNGLTPVLRMELSDSNLFDAAVKRIEEKAGKALITGDAKGRSYKYVDAKELKLIIATLDGQAVITAVPAKYDETQVALALGVKTPRRSLKKSKTLREINKEYGFSGYLTGFIDTQRLAGILTGDTTAQDDEVFAAIEKKLPEVTAVCAAEIMGMAGIAPRVVFGYPNLAAQQIESAMIVELRADIADGLSTIPAAVPGLGRDVGGLMSFGIGVDLLALREFYEARLDAMEAEPYECEMFAELQAGVAKGRQALSQPLPPVVYSFRGFVANIADIQGLDLSSSTPPESVEASLLIAVENAEALVMMVALMDPQVAALNLVPDGKPVRLDFPQLAEIADEAFAALSNNALSISLGDGAEAISADMLVADSAEPAPFLSMNMDSARYYSIIGDVMSREPSGDAENEMPEAVRDALRDVMALSGSLYERMSVEIQFTKRGVEINGLMKLSD